MPEHGTKHERKRYIVIPNWETFQHKDIWKKSGGRPYWIKNYTRLIHKDEYLDLTLSQRGVLHGVWMMYAASGQVLSEERARHLLCTNKGESRHFLDTLRALSDAGFLRIQSHPEEIREEEKRKPPSREPVDNSVSSPPAPQVLALVKDLERAQRGGTDG